MRFHGRNKDSPVYSDALLIAARNILTMDIFTRQRGGSGTLDHDLADITGVCLGGQEGTVAATTLCHHFLDAITNNRIYAFDFPRLLNSLARAHPEIFLDVFLGNNEVERFRHERMFSEDFEKRENPLSQISDATLISWCGGDPENRFSLIALSIQAFSRSNSTGQLEWKPIVYTLFEKAPNLSVVLENLAKRIRPSGWSGSLADILLKRAVLFQSLGQHHNAEVRAWARHRHSDLLESIEKEREREGQRDRRENESFE